jgi:DNA mismatch repair ATPase MutL
MTPEERKAEYMQEYGKKRRASRSPEQVEADKSRARENYDNNRQAKVEQSKKWREDNLEVRLAYEVEYRSSEEHKKKKQEYDKQYRASRTPEQVEAGKERLRNSYDKDIAVARSRKWREDNPEKTKLSRIMAQGRRRSAGEKNRFSVEDVTNLYGTDCHICGEAIDMDAPRRAGAEGWRRSFWIDHVVALANGGHHTLENVKPSHAECNLNKSAT